MNHPFTAEDAFDASEAGDPIILCHGEVMDIIEAHHAADMVGDFYQTIQPTHPVGAMGGWDAADLLAWLGY